MRRFVWTLVVVDIFPSGQRRAAVLCPVILPRDVNRRGNLVASDPGGTGCFPSAETESTALDALHQRKDELNEDVLVMMDQLAGQLRESGNAPVADRLDALRKEAIELVL